MAGQKNDTEDQSPDGNSRQGVTVVRVLTIRGTSLSQKEVEINLRRNGRSGTKTVKKMRKEKLNCTNGLRLQSWTKNKKKEKEE